MSVSYHVDVDLSCDNCYDELYDGDYIYCKRCAKPDNDPKAAHNEAVEILGDWLDDNRLILSKNQQDFVELMLESVRRERMPDISSLKALTA